MVGAFTTAAVINHSLAAPKEPVGPLRWMPNAENFEQGPRQLTDEELAAESEYNLKALRLSLQMKAEQAKAKKAKNG